MLGSILSTGGQMGAAYLGMPSAPGGGGDAWGTPTGGTY